MSQTAQTKNNKNRHIAIVLGSLLLLDNQRTSNSTRRWLLKGRVFGKGEELGKRSTNHETGKIFRRVVWTLRFLSTRGWPFSFFHSQKEKNSLGSTPAKPLMILKASVGCLWSLFLSKRGEIESVQTLRVVDTSHPRYTSDDSLLHFFNLLIS